MVSTGGNGCDSNACAKQEVSLARSYKIKSATLELADRSGHSLAVRVPVAQLAVGGPTAGVDHSVLAQN